MDILDPNRLLQFISCLSYKYYESFPTIFMGGYTDIVKKTLGTAR